jgi:thermostable 8-oxoguanine DNA glycosylase
MNNFIITEKDINEAKRYYKLDGILVFTLGNLFKAALYSLLSIGQLYKTQKYIFSLLLDYNLDSSENILNNIDLFRSIIYKTRFSKSIEKYILYLCNNWDNKIKGLFIEIIEDKDRKKGYYFRNRLVKEIKGFGYKVASLFLDILGYEDIAVIDIWILRFLKDRGYSVAYNERKGGLSKEKYLLYEHFLKMLAGRFDFFVAFFQCIIWCKLSSWNKKESKEQLFFDFWNEV